MNQRRALLVATLSSSSSIHAFEAVRQGRAPRYFTGRWVQAVDDLALVPAELSVGGTAFLATVLLLTLTLRKRPGEKEA